MNKGLGTNHLPPPRPKHTQQCMNGLRQRQPVGLFFAILKTKEMLGCSLPVQSDLWSGALSESQRCRCSEKVVEEGPKTSAVTESLQHGVHIARVAKVAQTGTSRRGERTMTRRSAHRDGRWRHMHWRQLMVRDAHVHNRTADAGSRRCDVVHATRSCCGRVGIGHVQIGIIILPVIDRLAGQFLGFHVDHVGPKQAQPRRVGYYIIIADVAVDRARNNVDDHLVMSSSGRIRIGSNSV